MKNLEIIEEDLKYNLDIIKSKIDIDKTKIIAIVKANGMGLDLIKYSEFLIKNDVNILAVANSDEAIKLREANIKVDIIMLSEIYSDKELEELIDNDIILTIGNLEEKSKIEEIAKSKNKIVKCHIKIDTGFARYGFIYSAEEEILEAVKNSEYIKICGVYTHFSKAIDKKWTNIQFGRFSNLIGKIKEINDEVIFHAANSTAFLLYPEMKLDAVRLRFNNTR